MEKQLIPELRFPGFKDNWEEKKLGEISKVERGRFSPRPRNNPIYYNGDIPFVQTSDVVNSKGRIINYTQTLNEKGLKVSKLFPKGTILITIAANIGYSGVLQIDMACPDSLIGIKCYKNTSNYFLHYLLEIEQPKLDYLAIDGAQKNINLEFLRPYCFYIPFLSEQQKIASFLTDVDAKITKLTKKKTLLEQYKKGIMQKIFNQELRFKDDDGNAFSSWNVKTLGGIASINMGQSPESSTYNSDGNGYYLIQGNADISNRKTTPRNWTSNPTKLCDIGDLILTVRAPVGAVAKSNHKACIGRGVCSIKNKAISNIEFIYQFLLDYEKRWARLEQGSTFTAVSGKDIKSIEINLPSIEEQTKIANFLSDIDLKIEALNNKIEDSKSFKKGLLQQMFV